MFSHDGHGNPALGTPGAVKVKHSIYYTGVHGFGAGFEFAYEPGPITNLALVTIGRRPVAIRDLRGRSCCRSRRGPSPRRRRCSGTTRWRSPTGATPGCGPAPPTTWARRGVDGPRSSCISRRCSASKPSSSERGHGTADPAAGLRDRPQGLSAGAMPLSGWPSRPIAWPQRLGVSVVFNGQAVDIPAIAAATRHILVFAQHMDPVDPGRGVGGCLAEALRDAGAVGTLLNHSEKPMTRDDLARAIESGAIGRPRDAGLRRLSGRGSEARAPGPGHRPGRAAGADRDVACRPARHGRVRRGDHRGACEAVDPAILVHERRRREPPRRTSPRWSASAWTAPARRAGS